jgi:hypothetical protein
MVSWILILGMMVPLQTAVANSNGEMLTFGVVPQQAAKKLAKKWGNYSGVLTENNP